MKNNYIYRVYPDDDKLFVEYPVTSDNIFKETLFEWHESALFTIYKISLRLK